VFGKLWTREGLSRRDRSLVTLGILIGTGKPSELKNHVRAGLNNGLTVHELQEVLIQLWRREKITAMMVPHDVDEALFLSDRIVCMTDGPEAEVGDIIEVKFPRPRDRKSVMEHPDYYPLRERLIEFLEVHAHKKKQKPAPPEAGPRPSAAAPKPNLQLVA